jgi:hypothetical protein
MDLLFSSLSIKRALYVILVALTVYLVKWSFPHLQADWLIWSAFLLSLILTGDSFKRRLSAIIITGLLAGFASFIAASLGSSPFFLALYLFIVTMICVVVGQRYPAIFLQTCIINLFVMLTSSMDTLASNLDHFELICIGVLITVLLQFVFYPYFIRNELKPWLVISLRNIKKLNQEIFSCLLDAEYTDNLYLYERRVHVRKTDFFHAMNRLREVTHLAETKLSAQEKESHEWWLVELNALFENIMDYSQLRRRVTDYSTFSVCSQELKSIVNELDKCFDAIIKYVKTGKYVPYTNQLNININALEDNYQHVLQVAAPEPVAFLLFIDSLNAFSEKLKILYSHDLPASSQLS